MPRKHWGHAERDIDMLGGQYHTSENMQHGAVCCNPSTSYPYGFGKNYRLKFIQWATTALGT